MNGASKKRGRIAAALSGGVDSSVAAAILVQQGYEVIGLTMKLFDRGTVGESRWADRGCCNLDAIRRAAAVCHTLNIPHYSIDLMDDFNQYVIQDFISEYIAGKTPNPCVRCNTYLKWGSLFQRAKQLDCDYIMTGHYAKLIPTEDGYQLLRAKDRQKDQSYALWGIPHDMLPNTLLPLGSMTKGEVRKIAAELGLKTANTPESKEICFVPSGHYSEFIIEQRPELKNLQQPGDLIEDEQVVGEHSGYIHYTVGQRRGFGGGFTEPRFVLAVDPERNQVRIGTREQLLQRCLVVDQLNWLIPESQIPREAAVQARYRMKAELASLFPYPVASDADAARLIVIYHQPVEAITPGQSAVFYQDERLLGGGRIERVLSENELQQLLQVKV